MPPDTDLGKQVAPDGLPPTIKGAIDAVADGRVYGWAWNPDRPGDYIAIDLFHAGEPIGTTIAEMRRPDLESNGVGDGCHAFVFVLPDGHADATIDTIAAMVAGTAIPLPRLQPVIAAPEEGARDNQIASLAHRVTAIEATLGQLLQAMRVLVERSGASDQSTSRLIGELTTRQRELGESIVGAGESLQRLEQDIRRTEDSVFRMDSRLKTAVKDEGGPRRWWSRRKP